jgi:uncharacterized protein involved in outer membrane biogenesis
MKRGTRILLWLIGSIVVLVAVIVVIVVFHLGNVVKTAVETVGPRYTGSAVELESVRIRPLRGKAGLRGLRVGNPEGYKTPDAIRLGEISVSLKIASVNTDTIRIEHIIIDGPELTYEKSLKKSNLAAILANVQAAIPAQTGEDETTPAEEADASTPGKKVIIERLIVRNGKIRLSTGLLQGKALTVPLPTIEMHDIGKEKDLSVAETISLVLSQIFNTAIAAVLQSVELVGKGAKVLGETALDGVSLVGDAAGTLAGGISGISSGAVGAAGQVVGDTIGAGVDVLGSGAHAVGAGAGAVGDVAAQGAKKLGRGLTTLWKGPSGTATNSEAGGADSKAEDGDARPSSR